MRRFLWLLSVLPFLFFSCAELDDSDEGLTVVTATEAVTESFDLNTPVIAIDNKTKSVFIENIPAGKKVYLAKVNPTSAVVGSSYTRYVTDATGISLTSASGTSSRSAAGTENVYTEDNSEASEDFFEPVVNAEFTSDSARSASSSVSQVTAATYSTGDRRSFYVDHGLKNGSVSDFYQSNATLCAIGTFCYVWVVDGYLGTSNTKNTINASRAVNFANAFDSVYEPIHQAFGKESDELYINSSKTARGSMNSYSSTGTRINIIVYDIGADYGKSTNGSIAGYFSNKDYYASGVANYSNAGKYLYVDAYDSVYRYKMVCSTIAHEFQHMINWNTKMMQNGRKSSTWYNEMLSMLCEDYVQKILGVEDYDSPKNRISRFEGYYRDNGLEYRSSGALLSYAASYAFGAWIIRQFNGEQIIRELSTNSTVDVESVVNAVTAVTGENYSIERLLAEYSQACIYNEDIQYQYPTFNQSPGQLTSIDLWWYKPKDSKLDSVRGPILYGYNDQYELRPYGINLVEIGTVDLPGGVLIRFNETGAANQKLYVFIQYMFKQ